MVQFLLGGIISIIWNLPLNFPFLNKTIKPSVYKCELSILLLMVSARPAHTHARLERAKMLFSSLTHFLSHFLSLLLSLPSCNTQPSNGPSTLGIRWAQRCRSAQAQPDWEPPRPPSVFQSCGGTSKTTWGDVYETKQSRVSNSNPLGCLPRPQRCLLRSVWQGHTLSAIMNPLNLKSQFHKYGAIIRMSKPHTCYVWERP